MLSNQEGNVKLGIDSTQGLISKFIRKTSLVVLSLVMAEAAFASPPPPVVDDCSALRVMDFSKISNGDAATKVMSGTLIKGVELTPAEARQISRRGMVMGAPFSATSKRLPDHCLVMGYVSPHIKFELRLPTPENW